MNRRNLKVLVADDQEDVREVFSRVLGSMGYVCDTCIDGRECLSRFSEKSYDILFLDLVMPEVSGEIVLRWLRSRHPRTAVVVTSVQDDEGVIREMLALGATAYLVKPFTTGQIQAVMRGIENRRTAAGMQMVAAC